MSSRNDEEEKARRINWAIWLPTVVAIVGFAAWFFLFVILDFGGENSSQNNLQIDACIT